MKIQSCDQRCRANLVVAHLQRTVWVGRPRAFLPLHCPPPMISSSPTALVPPSACCSLLCHQSGPGREKEPWGVTKQRKFNPGNYWQRHWKKLCGWTGENQITQRRATAGSCDPLRLERQGVAKWGLWEFGNSVGVVGVVLRGESDQWNPNNRGDALKLVMLLKAGEGESTLAFPSSLIFSLLPTLVRLSEVSWQGNLGNIACMGHPHSNFHAEQSREEKEVSQSTNRQ